MIQDDDKKPIHDIIDVNMYEVVEFLATAHKPHDDFIEILASNLELIIDGKKEAKETISILIIIHSPE